MPDFRRGTDHFQRTERTGEVFEAGFLPDAEKERLCRSLLAEFGATHVRPGGDGELIHGCLLPFGNHKDQDRNPTASLNFRRLAYNCLSGETLVKTFEGERPISELAGSTHRLLDGDGKWVDAPVRQYGVDRLYRVTLSRNGVKREVYATADHRWYVRPKGTHDRASLRETTTLGLKPKQRIPSVWTAHRERFLKAGAKRTYERTNWWVTSVEETDRVEPVYCAEVSTTSSFVLAGNILTGNCLGCGSGGGLLWFIGLCRDESGDKARRWLEDQTGTGSDEQSLSSLMEFFDGVYDQKRNVEPPMPKMDAKVLTPWLAIHPYMTEVRGVSEEVLMDFRVGYGTIRCRVDGDRFIQSERIVIPHFWKSTLVGWQTRRLSPVDGTPKYLSSPDFPKDRTLYSYQVKAKEAVIVEAPMSVLSKAHLDPHIEGTFGAKVTDRQVRLIAMHPRVVLFMDNDDAGWNATRRVAEALDGYSIVKVAQNPWAADPGDMDDETYLGCLEDAVPYALWSPPTTLEAWAA